MGESYLPLSLKTAKRDIEKLMAALEAKEAQIEDLMYRLDNFNGMSSEPLIEGVHLTQQEARILGRLIDNAGRLVTHDSIFIAMGSPRDGQTPEQTKVRICHIRKKLAAAREEGIRVPDIQTVWGQGYKLTWPE